MPPSPHFSDNWLVDDKGFNGSWAQPWVEQLFTEALTNGCSSVVVGGVTYYYYCPWQNLTRIQAAKFGLMMKHGSSYTPPAATGTLADVYCANPDVLQICWGVAWAEQAYAEGLLVACGESGGKPMFCPNDPLGRNWTAYMIAKAKGLDVLYNIGP
jgi:hypothetical protein